MKRIILTGALAVVLALAAAPTAQAKGYIKTIRVCGPSGCAPAVAPRSAMLRFGMDMLTDAGPAVASPPLLPYYRLRFVPRYELPGGDTFYIPGARAMCTDGGCTRVPRGLVPGLAAAAANAASYTPRISSVTVNDRHRADVNRFAILFNQRPAALPSTTVWQSRHYSVIVEFTQVTPWSLGGASWISYYPRYHVLSRDGVWFHAGASVDLLVRGQAARADGGDDNRGLGIAAAAAVVLAAAAGAGRRLRRPRSG
jgi:hypothetical protein